MPAFVSSLNPPPVLSPDPWWFVANDAGLLVHRAGDELRLPTAAEVEALGVTERLYLGRLGEVDCLAGHLPSAAVPAPGFAVENLRKLFDVLGEERFVLAGRAVQLLGFESTHRFCGRCATPLEPISGERGRRCPSCQLTAYPRVSPAVIVLVRRGEEALLARSSRFPVAFFSTLAGFVEPGESLEETVAREIREEVGVEVRNLRYFGSQPWPFPHSLMVAFVAEYAGGEIAVDGEEIAEAAWFRRDALPRIPPKTSIARRLIDAWVEGA